MPITTLRLDASFEGTILETSDAWFDETDTLVSMDDFVGQTVDIILDAPPSVTLQANQVFNNVVINNITSNGAQYLTGDSRGDLYHVADGGVVGNGNDDRIFFSYGAFGSTGTINFDGLVRFSSIEFDNDEFAGLEETPLFLSFMQSDAVDRSISISSSSVYADVMTDEYSQLDMIYSSVIGGHTLTVNGGLLTGAFYLKGQILLNGADAWVNRFGTSTVTNATNDATALTVQGDNTANTITDNTTLSITGRIDMGSGFDSVTLNGAVNGDIALGGGADTLVLTGSYIGNITGGKGDDIVDMSLSKSKDVRVTLGNGDDVFLGGSGDETILGSGGNDTISGGAGRDIIVGGKGADVFVFVAGDSDPSARDQIRDFRRPQGDMIDMSRIEDAFFSDADSFSGTAGEIIAVSKYVLVDVDGDGFSDLEIDMRKNHLLTEADFILGDII
ncbi:calcium-binding protein [uncultured Pseudosulfitobacter sp.]|uniref:calcium-binding protein n=1 Tax=uncultured Pseudosulfitobacter sp. TaxID=2854214 RepID=UPI0030DA02AE|tara:strand:+ start:11992 stop:13329 length:1338 start_codon:yes stop_codon:yes gene_type:complete